MSSVVSEQQLADIQARAIEKLWAFAPGIDDRIYHWVDGEEVNWTDGWGWTDGFWPGVLWLAHEATGEDKWADLARKSGFRFRQRIAAHESHTHDMGFLFSPTAVAEYTITGDKEMREMALAAARAVITRFNPFGRFIRAWNIWDEDASVEARNERRGKAIIDTMMNLHLLWWAERETGSAEFGNIAEEHASTTRRYFCREDGSTFHTFIFDPETGDPLHGRTHQGYADGSCWSRGQAWAIYGFSLAHAWTGREEHLETARSLAKYWLDNIPENGVPPWDFNAPDGASLPDTSAATVAACGLMELASHVGGSEAESYRDVALKSLVTLDKDFRQPEQHMGLLSNGVSSKPKGIGIGVSLVYGDYFYIEALLRAQGRERFCWRP